MVTYALIIFLLNVNAGKFLFFSINVHADEVDGTDISLSLPHTLCRCTLKLS